MGDELAAANVNRSYSLAATSIAIFTFLLFFMYPRFATGEVDALLFQATLIVMGVATFSFAFASLYYYGSSLSGRIDDAERIRFSRRGDHFWLRRRSASGSVSCGSWRRPASRWWPLTCRSRTAG